MSSVSWLHLTDLHFGMKAQGWLWPRVRETFLRDLTELRELAGPWDFVLFSGDLVQSGAASEFDAVQELLADLWSHFETLGCSPLLLSTPGNHDLTRPNPQAAVVRALRHWHSEADLQQLFWAEENSEYRTCVTEALKNYEKWWASRAESSLCSTRGLLPGDYRIEFDCRDLRVGCVSLNSTFLQLESGDYEGHLVVDPRQYAAVIGTEFDWLSEVDVPLVMTHHPINWLHKTSREGWFSEISPAGRFSAHFFGHMHENRSQALSLGGAPPRVEFQGASLFGLESYADRNGSNQKRIHGYSAFRFCREDNGDTLTVWPRAKIDKQAGHFDMGPDTSLSLDSKGSFTLSVRTVQQRKHGKSAAASPETGHFVEVYRESFKKAFLRWDTVNPATSSSVSPSMEASLAEMYIPLRLASAREASNAEYGRVLTPQQVKDLSQPLLIRGRGGVGKTTWLRWTFGRLLEDSACFPVLVELRRVMQHWLQPQATRSIEAYLEHSIQEYMGASWKGCILEALRNPSTTGVILIDGWDETGDLGSDFRKKLLAFMAQHPQLKVVVSSRPYGTGIPSHCEGFGIAEVMPFSDQEIKSFTVTYFRCLHRSDAELARNRADYFLSRARNSAAALELMRTPLLLTMMLRIGHESSLPETRQELIQVCVETLLNTQPDNKQSEGGQLEERQWRPNDRDKRIAAVAGLAFNLQSTSKALGGRKEIISSRAKLTTFLPKDWQRHKQQRFLNYLLCGAGLLTDYSDGSLSFVHQCFCEYLAAYFLFTTTGEQEWFDIILERVESEHWTEPLRLLAQLIQAGHPKEADHIVKDMIERGGKAFWLAGCFLSDGVGEESTYSAWLNQLTQLLGSPRPEAAGRCIRAWGENQSSTRLKRMALALHKATERCSWVAWVRLWEWARLTNCSNGLPGPRSSRCSELAIETLHGRFTSKEALGVARIWFGGCPYWAPPSWELILLRLWPTKRIHLGCRLQVLASLTENRAALLALTAFMLRHPLDSASERTFEARLATQMAEFLACDGNFNSALMEFIGREIVHSLIGSELPHVTYADRYSMVSTGGQRNPRPLARLFGREFARYWSSTAVSEPIPNVSVPFAQRWVMNFPVVIMRMWEMISDLSRGQILEPTRSIQGWARYLATADFIVGEGLHPAIPSEFWNVEFLSCGRMGPGPLLSALPWIGGRPEGRLIAAAWLLNRGAANEADYQRALDAYPKESPRLWLALAAHLARRSNDADRQFLEETASEPTTMTGALADGLQFLVRGDVVLNDGTTVTLDEITNQLGLPPIPLLDEVEEPFDIDWGQAIQYRLARYPEGPI